MNIIGYEASAIEAKRFTQQGEHLANIRIDHNSTVTRISKVSEETASAEFRFTANYSGMGYIKIEGSLVLRGEVDALVEAWTSTSSMPDQVANLVHNAIVSNCIPTALLIARDIRLPPPFPMPRINVQKKGDPSKRSQPGPEFA
jgi:hypothetical protein